MPAAEEKHIAGQPCGTNIVCSTAMNDVAGRAKIAPEEIRNEDRRSLMQSRQLQEEDISNHTNQKYNWLHSPPYRAHTAERNDIYILRSKVHMQRAAEEH